MESFFEPWQQPAEIEVLVARCRGLRPRAILEIGTARGGTLRCWLECASPGATVISVDLPWKAEDHRELFRSWAPPGVTLHLLHADSHDPATLAEVARLAPVLDFLFIDGDHTYRGVKQDFDWYAGLVRPGGLVALHDIHPSAATPEIAVPRFWRELRAGDLRTEEIVADPGQAGFGIGLVYP